MYTIAWAIQFEPIFDNSLPWQVPSVIDLREVIEKKTTTDGRDQKEVTVKTLILTRLLTARLFET